MAEKEQEKFKSHEEVMTSILANGFYADATLVVGKNKVKISIMKEILLQFHSSVLSEKLENPTNQNFHPPIFDFEDVELEPFQNFLKYAYTGVAFTWSSQNQVDDFPALLSLWKLAYELKIVDLQNKLQLILQDFVDKYKCIFKNQDICQLFHLANAFGDFLLKEKALNIILSSALNMISDLEFHQILTTDDLIEILSRDDLKVESECQLFHFILRWTRSKCIHEGLEGTLEVLREKLKQLFPLIRFNQMTMMEFMEEIYPTNLLTNEQLSEIFPILYYKTVGKPQPSYLFKSTSLLVLQKGPRVYQKSIRDIPDKILMKILSLVHLHNLHNCRLVSTSFKNLIDNQLVVLKIELTPSSLLDFKNVYENGHLFRKVIFRTENFTRLESEQLVTFLVKSKILRGSIILNLDLDSVFFQTLTSFFASTRKLGLQNERKLIVNLKIDKILNASQSSSSLKSSTVKYTQLSSLSIKSLTTHDTTLDCLIAIIENAPNLKELLIGDMTSRLTWTALKSSRLVQFFKCVHLKNIKISCSLFYLDTPALSTKYFLHLKEQNVKFKKINFNYCPCPKSIPFMEIFQDELEETFCLSVPLKETLIVPPKTFPNLKILQIECRSIHWVFHTLERTPNLQQLIWNSDGDYDKKKLTKWTLGQLQLPKLNKIVLDLYSSFGQETVELLSSFCPNVRQFRCQNVDQFSILWLYQHFPLLEHLEFSTACVQSPGFVEIITGVKGHVKTGDGANRSQLFIGNLTNLRYLNFGLLNYQPSSHWHMDLAVFTNGICYLSLLEEIMLPPMKLKWVDAILNCLSSSSLNKLKTILVQVTSMPIPGSVTNSDVDQLNDKFEDLFQVKSSPVTQYDGIHCSLYY